MNVKDHIDYYAILEQSPLASAEEIKNAYYRLAMKRHPDKGGTAEQFIQLVEAWEVLSDPEIRARYDASRKNPQDAATTRNWQSASQRAHTKAKETTQRYGHNWERYRAWMDALSKDVVAAQYSEGDYSRFQFPSAGDSLSGQLCIAGGVVAGAIVITVLYARGTFLHWPPNTIDLYPIAGILIAGATLGQWVHKGFRDDLASRKSDVFTVPCRCGKNLRLKRIYGHLAVRCPACNRRFGLNINDAGAREECPKCSQESTWDGNQCKQCDQASG